MHLQRDRQGWPRPCRWSGRLCHPLQAYARPPTLALAPASSQPVQPLLTLTLPPPSSLPPAHPFTSPPTTTPHPTGRPWPVLVGLGFGLGQGYSDCERVFNPAAIPGFKIASASAADPTRPAPPPSAYANFAPLSANLRDKASEVKAAVVGKADEVRAKGEAAVAKGEAKVDKAGAKVEAKAAEVKADLKDGKKWV